MHTMTRKVTPRSRKLALPSSLLALLIASTACHRQEGAVAAGTDNSSATAEISESKASPSSTGVAAGDTSNRPGPSTLAYLCEAGPACESDVLGASTADEAKWLMQNGYPSPEQLERFEAMSNDQLKKEADSGSLAAMVNYGERLVSNGDSKGGLVYIFDATQRGSIYGYYAMSGVYQHTPGLTSIVESGAYLRVAYILGDSKASEELQRRFPGLQQVEQAAIDRRASSLYQTFAHTKQPTPRP